MKIFVVDDEPHAIKTIKLLLDRIEGCELIGSAGNIEDAVRDINLLKPQVLFLDICINDRYSFEIINKINYTNYKIVFITAYSNFALKAIKYSAFDYLLKPLNPFDLKDVCKRLVAEDENSIENRVRLLEEAILTKKDVAKIVLKTASKYYIVSPEEIIHLNADNSYTTAFLTENREYLLCKPLKHFEEILEDHGFFRSNRSHLVQMAQIRQLVKTEGGYLIMSNGNHIPLSPAKASQLKERLDTEYI